MDKLSASFHIFLVLSLGMVSANSNSSSSNDRHGQPFFEDGKICRETMEMVEEMEYDNQVLCRVMMEETCDPDNEEETNQVCHTMYKKECEISYRPHMTKVKVKVCPNGEVDLNEDGSDMNSVVIDVRPNPPNVPAASVEGKCKDGKRIVCLTKYETECRTEYIKHRMEEDRPRCRVQLVERCDPQCEQVPAMRCTIEKMMVTKSKPDTRCHRIPRQMCRKEACDVPSLECYFRTQVVNEVVPEEQCHFRPHRLCHQVKVTKKRQTDNDDDNFPMFTTPSPDRFKMGKNCVRQPVQKCQTLRVNPRPVTKPMKKKVCRETESPADILKVLSSMQPPSP